MSDASHRSWLRSVGKDTRIIFVKSSAESVIFGQRLAVLNGAWLVGEIRLAVPVRHIFSVP